MSEVQGWSMLLSPELQTDKIPSLTHIATLYLRTGSVRTFTGQRKTSSRVRKYVYIYTRAPLTDVFKRHSKPPPVLCFLQSTNTSNNNSSIAPFELPTQSPKSSEQTRLIYNPQICINVSMSCKSILYT